MSDSSIAITEGSGKNLHSWGRTISATLVQDQFTLPGEYPYRSYVATAAGVSTATANSHLMQIMGWGSGYVRIRRIWVAQNASAGSNASSSVQVLRLTTAGTGGTTVTPARMDLNDASASCTAMTLPSSKGTESDILLQAKIGYASGLADGTNLWTWQQHPSTKPIIISNSTSAGIAIKQITAVASATVNIIVEFVETSWLGDS